VKSSVLTTVHVAALVAVAGASLAEGAYGAELVAIPVQVVAALAGAGAVLRRRKATIGVIVAGWLALGPFVMPFVSDNLSSARPGLVASTVAYLAALAVALASGALALMEDRRSARSEAPTQPRR
jgi:protein-S-isoprenylcysteine O-methyltransferase Ste14